MSHQIDSTRGSRDRGPSLSRGVSARVLLDAAVALAAGLTGMAPGAASAADCTGDPLFVTDQCTDPRFNAPVIDLVEQRATPSPHTYMHGHF